ncbi:hypothetical protein Golob_012462, partial [Gossypium lobatum]|nr:hypothetical protein [Gossypium lobatum]
MDSFTLEFTEEEVQAMLQGIMQRGTVGGMFESLRNSC